MVSLYVNGFASQTFTGSDRSRGVATVQKVGDQEVLDFNFYAHAHPGFWITKQQLAAGQPIMVNQIAQQQEFTVQVQ